MLGDLTAPEQPSHAVADVGKSVPLRQRRLCSSTSVVVAGLCFVFGHVSMKCLEWTFGDSDVVEEGHHHHHHHHRYRHDSNKLKRVRVNKR